MYPDIGAYEYYGADCFPVRKKNGDTMNDCRRVFFTIRPESAIHEVETPEKTLLIFLQTVGRDMIFHVNGAKKLDTERDFSSAERHVLQKLLFYKVYVGSIEEFRRKKQMALNKGWNNTGPLAETPNLVLVVAQMEREILLRLKKEDNRQ